MVDVYGLAGIIIFYTLVLAIGVWAGTKQKNHGEEEVMLAGRNVGLFVGVLTLTATWVGGGYINATAEALFTTGLVWCQVPLGYSLALVVGALLFVKPMREASYVTMLDPFQQAYGNRIGGLLFLPALCGDVFWIASVLSSLGASLMVILDISNTWSVTISTIFAAAYTVSGGLYSVTYTDVLQLICIVIGLCLSFPFAISNAQPYLKEPNMTIFSKVDWLGTVETKDYGLWIEGMLLLAFGGIPWQSYFQRVLSLRSTKAAYHLSTLSALLCFSMAIPAGAFGIIARMVDWSAIPTYGKNFTAAESNSVLPLVLKELTPNWVAFFGLGAVTAAVMSSADAGILSSSSMFTRNIYKLSFRPKASERELIWVLRISIAVIATLACIIALSSVSIYYLSVLCSDIVYVILFPQLVLVIYWAKHVNNYGCLSSYLIGLLLRISGGEIGIGIPAFIKYPGYDYVAEQQKFPFKTFAMLMSALSHMLISALAAYVFQNNILSPDKWDVLNAFPDLHINGIEKEHNGKELRSKEGIIKSRSNKAVTDAVKGTRYSDVTIVSNLDQSPPDGSVVAHEFSKF
ncbi:hypothetical protein M8J77_005430 [Diaphorina citri]|nr:hypothetical protein M8J77_005430 [Diaphorina citri]